MFQSSYEIRILFYMKYYLLKVQCMFNNISFKTYFINVQIELA